MAIAPSTHAQLLSSSLAFFLLLFIPSRSSALGFRTSAISSAPSALPRLPRYVALPPTLAPDVMPRFPSPGAGGGVGAAPASSLPTIPSSPSPPNPDALPQPDSDIAPLGAAASAAAAPAAGGAALAAAVVAAWWCLGNHGR
ncbi:Classical arabinogalactan protein 26 [Ananas comosus]|nr:Classical arabinogalactan protein 26 [Ananas comosus]